MRYSPRRRSGSNHPAEFVAVPLTTPLLRSYARGHLRQRWQGNPRRVSPRSCPAFISSAPLAARCPCPALPRHRQRPAAPRRLRPRPDQPSRGAGHLGPVWAVCTRLPAHYGIPGPPRRLLSENSACFPSSERAQVTSFLLPRARTGSCPFPPGIGPSSISSEHSPKTWPSLRNWGTCGMRRPLSHK
jgi:hypothetical protein